jgi:glutamyl-tRNA reductase
VGSNGGHALPCLLVVGTSHRRADLPLRERLHLAPSDAAALAERLAGDGFEAVVLSTCNRTEVYLASPDPAEAGLAVRDALVERSGLAQDDLEAVLEERRDADAALHLFRVAAGLDSLLPGEAQILGQVREAYDLAKGAGATGRILNRLFTYALHAGKRVRHETGVGTVPAAIPAAAADLARRLVGDLESRRVLVIGAGKMGGLAAESFLARGAERIFVANHRIERAEELVRRFGGEAVPFERIGEELARADVVLSSTRCPQVVLHAADVEAALARREGRPLLLVDIAVPRDLDPAIADLEGCTLYDLDALGPVAGEAVARRDEATREAEAIVAEEADAFVEWLRALDVVPVVAALRRRAEAIRARELARAEPRLQGLSEADRREVEVLTAQIVNKLLHDPTVRVKEAAASRDGGEYADALRELFALDEGVA